MQTKTIKAVLSKKFDEFLNSIDNDEVKALVKENSIITGGSIASLLLGEDVNDYDLYFTDADTTEKVANYYVRKFLATDAVHKHKNAGNIDIHVERKAAEGEPYRIKIMIKSAGIAGEKGEEDYQYFEQRPDQEAEDYVNSVVDAVKGDEIEVEAKEARPKYRPVFLSANAITLSNKIQIVIRFYGDAKTIHQHYDYIHCTNYWLSKDRQLYLNQPALEALLSRTLYYVGSEYPICSIIRTRKFIKRGWRINAGQYLKMCYQVSKLNLNNIDVLEDQLTGVDAAYFAQLIDGLRKHSEKEKEAGKTFDLSMGYLSEIIDKIF